MSKQLGVSIDPVENAREASQDVDILLAATSAMQPVLKGDWIEAGMHVGSINTRREIDRNTLTNSDYIVVNTREVGYSVYVAGSADGIPLLSEEDLDVGAYPDIGEVIIGKAKGRSSPEEKTLFLSNIGLGTQFAAVAAKVYEEARKRNVGQKIPSGWFLDTVKK
jgi:ornithine cyclodeaminase